MGRVIHDFQPLDSDLPTMSLSALRSRIDGWIEKYGPNAKVKMDAGHNNISIDIQPVTGKTCEYAQFACRRAR